MAAMTAESSSLSKTQYCGIDISQLPQGLFMQVLMFVPAAEVVKNCSRVSKYWLQVARDPELWRQKCELEGIYMPRIMGPPPENFMVFYFLNPYTRNLLKNVTAQDLSHWDVERHDTLSIEVENNPVGADPIARHVPSEEIGGQTVCNWVTSYIHCSMSQRVDLLKAGCSPAVLDELRPPIQVSAWCAARWDCGAEFQLEVRLLAEDGSELEKEHKEKDLDNGALRKVWHKVEHTFTDYKPGVRTVEFIMGGKDTQFWEGNYGSKFTLPCLHFVFNNQNN